MKLGAFIMTYNRAEVLAGTIERLLLQTRAPDSIVVVDNASTDHTADVVRERFPQVDYIGLEENMGPAGAACEGIRWALHQGCDWVYWGDDDDPPRWADDLERLLCLIRKLRQDDIGAVGAVGVLWDWQIGETQRPQDEALEGVLPVDCIGGNMQFIINCRAVEKAGLPDQSLFWGMEEANYCLRLKQAGYSLFVDGDLMMKYREDADRLGLAGKSDLRAVRAGDPINWAPRQYYSTRNYIYMMRRTFGRPDLARREVAKAIGRAVWAWQYGLRPGWLFSRLQIKAVVDGYLERMGKTVSLR